MSCNCGDCSNCSSTCIPIGPTGNGIASTVDNGDGTFTFTYTNGSTFTTSNLTGPSGVTVATYADHTAGIALSSADARWAGADTYYQPTGYTSLVYTNTSGVSQTALIDVNFTSGDTTLPYGSSDVTCGIFLTSNLVTPLYSVNNDIVYNAGASSVNISQTSNLFYRKGIDPGDGITIQFKTKSSGDGYLQQAQLLIQII